ncbi:response regulator [candidate division KSB1 bacterium]|nr:response regulator [candidate division KSB1 bacterium]
MPPVTIVIADDHALVRAGLCELLNTMENVIVKGQAGDGLEAIHKVREFKPDILVLDISMPKMRGLEVIKEIKTHSENTRILILSMHNKPDYVRESFRNGARGYLLKESAADELREAIKALARDEMYLSKNVNQSIINDWIEGSIRGSKELPGNAALTEREKSVMKLLAEGHTNKQVAQFFHISSKTVETHRYRIMEKLKLENFAALVKYAIKSGMIDLE